MSSSLDRLIDNLESTISEREELLERHRKLRSASLSAAGDAIRTDRRARRQRAAAELVAAVLKREVDLPEFEPIRAETLRAAITSRAQGSVRASGPKKRRAVEDEQALQEAAEAVRHRAGGSVDRAGLLRHRLENLHDSELAETLAPLVEVVEDEEAAARPAARG